MGDQTIFRKAKGRRNPYAQVDRALLEDATLSYRARGLAGYILAKPDDWKVWMADLIKSGTEGEHAIRTAVRELIEAGYLVRFKERDPGTGQWTNVTYELHERPVPEDQRTKLGPRGSGQEESPHGGFPHVGEPHVGEPRVENHVLTNTHDTNTQREIEGMDVTEAISYRLEHPEMFEAEEAWQLVKDELFLQFTKATYDTWLRGVDLLGVQNGEGTKISLLCPSSYHVDWLSNRLHTPILRTWAGVLGKNEEDVEIVYLDRREP